MPVVESRTGAVAWAMRQRSVSRPRSSNRTCGLPASGFPTGFTARHTAARRVRCVLPKQWAMADAPNSTDRRPSSPRGKASSEASGCSGVFQAHRQSPILGSVQSAPEVRALSSASITQPQRSYGPLRLPSDPPPVRRWGCQPRRDGSPPMTRITLPACRAPYPGGSRRVPVSIASPLTRPSPFPRRVGIRIFTFEASSGFTPVTARWIAQPPPAAFVTRLRPGRLPCQAARQLPEQSTTLRVEPSSTGDTRRRGALGNVG